MRLEHLGQQCFCSCLYTAHTPQLMFVHEVMFLCDQIHELSLVRLVTHVQLSFAGSFKETELRCLVQICVSVHQALH